MPKQQELYPEELFKKDEITFDTIPVNAYKDDPAAEKKQYTEQDFINAYHDMCLLREFETVLDRLKLEGSYNGVEYKHAGPAHLSMGQEAAAVGQALALDVRDITLGSHRSHSEVLAKGLAAIRELDGDQLLKTMRNFFDGQTLSVVETGDEESVTELARKFLVYGAYAEMFARVTGFNKGWGGSMHVFFTPFGIYPNNAVVGGSGSIAPGVALYNRVNNRSGIVVANIGDASFGCGPVWEGVTFSSMDQFHKLWDEEHNGGLPILFNAMNNQYGMGGQTWGETMGFQYLARVGAGVNPDQMHAERVNGYNPLAVADAVRRKKSVLEEGRGPALLDTVTYRLSGHSPSDASTYRSREEYERFEQADAISSFYSKLTENGMVEAEKLDRVREEAQSVVFEMFKLAIDMDKSPRESVDSEFCASVMFSNQRAEKLDEREPEVLQNYEDNSRVKQIAGKHRYAYDENGKAVPSMKAYAVRDGIFEAMMHRFYNDPSMVAFGEENRDWGGAFACYRGLTEALPYHRLFNAPISEAGIAGAAVGYGMSGGRVVGELMYCDFLGRAGDEIFNQLSKWQAMSGGVLKMPVVMRISVGFKYGAQHSQEWSAIVNHIPGLKVAYPVTPYDAKGLLNSALAGTDPVIFFESQKCYGMGEQFVKEGVPEEYYEIEFGEPSVKKEGSDLTLITFGPVLYTAMEAAERLENDYGVSTEVIDLRTVVPLNYDKLVTSLEKTGKVLLATDAVERGCVMHNVAENLTQLAFDALDGPPVVVGSRNWVTPAAELEKMFFPQPEWMIDAVHERIMPLKGHTPATNQTLGELAQRYRYGV